MANVGQTKAMMAIHKFRITRPRIWPNVAQLGSTSGPLFGKTRQISSDPIEKITILINGVVHSYLVVGRNNPIKASATTSVEQKKYKSKQLLRVEGNLI
ncbi:hypothetical protein BLOT_000948 [Blomia tropicalis]|nr:hypothetical protein BLOT_000948 [Blomia tropicalis]